MNTIKKLNKKYENLDYKTQDEILKSSLLKKAKGFIVEEIITTKEIPPDMNAIKYLIELENLNQDRYANLTDEELRQEKLNLLKLLKEEEVYGDN